MRRVLARPVIALLAAPLLLSLPAQAQTTPPSPSSAQPNLAPGAAPHAVSVPYAPSKPGSPVVQRLVGGRAPLLVRKHVARAHPRHRYARHAPAPLAPERPALAGVTLLRPLPPPPQPPHIVVPLPDYPLDTVAAAFLTPPPPIVCHRTARIRGLPDPDLYKERTLVCEPDNP